MSIKSEIITKLTGTTTITDFTSARIAWGFIEQGTSRPYVICRLASAVQLMDLSNTGRDTDAQIQIESVDDTPMGAQSLSAVVKTALVGWGSTTCSPPIARMALTNEYDNIEGPVPQGSDRHLHSVMQEYSVWYE